MVDITHGTWIKDSKPVDKVYSNGVQVYGRNLWISSKAVSGYFVNSDSGLPTASPNKPNVTMLDPVTILSGMKSLIVTIYNPNKITNVAQIARIGFFNGSTYLGLQKEYSLTGETVQTVKWNIPAGATKMYLNCVLAEVGSSSLDSSINVKFEFSDQATPWTPAPEDLGITG